MAEAASACLGVEVGKQIKSFLLSLFLLYYLQTEGFSEGAKRWFDVCNK